MECKAYDTKMIPLSKAVRASIVDVYGDIGRLQELHSHWAGRELKVLQRQTLKLGMQYVLLDVNRNTMTATLPVDFSEETFVGFIHNDWKRVPLKINTKLVNINSIRDIPCEDKCPKCGQNEKICNDLTVTESVELITINDAVYEKTIIKKLYPNGDYFLETTTPILNVDDNTISYLTQKEFINNLDLKPCGCLETTPENLVTIRNCCPDVYCCYFSECSNVCNPEYGSYLILEDRNLIQLSPDYKFDKVYLEYWSHIPKKDGQLLVPELAFETLVTGTIFRSIKSKPGITNFDYQRAEKNYKTAKSDMRIVMTRLSIDSILQASMRTPKFDITIPPWRECFYRREETTVTTTSSTCDTAATTTTAGTNTVIYLYKNIEYKKVQFKVGQSGAPMVAGQTELTISDTQIFNGSVNVVLDGTVLYEDMTGSIYYGVVYSSTGVKITIYNWDIDNPALNLGVQTDQKYKITYTRTV